MLFHVISWINDFGVLQHSLIKYNGHLQYSIYSRSFCISKWLRITEG